VSSKSIRVLSVDDHAFLAEGLRARLGMESDMEFVGHCPSAAGLVAKVRELAADVVLLDIEMPGPDPFEAVMLLRRQCPAVRTIILSAFVRDSYVDATVKAGAWGYLAKSDDPEVIIAAIRDVVGGRFTLGPIVLERCRQIGRDSDRAVTAIPPPSPELDGTHSVMGASDHALQDSQPAEESGPAAAHSTPHPPGGTPAPTSRLAGLTPRELQVLRLIGKGLSRTEIADAIYRSPKTIDAHRSSIMEKLAIHDRVELARYAIREGLVEI